MARRLSPPLPLVDLDEIRARCATNAAGANEAGADSDSTKPRRLAPDRHPQQDFFLANLIDASPKDDHASMEHALYSLSKNPDTAVRKYERITVLPGPMGRATVWDKDIILFAIAQLVTARDAGEKISRTIRMQARDLLVFCNRGTGGRDYDLLTAGLTRLAGTRIQTDIATGKKRIRSDFGLLESWRYTEEDRDGVDGLLEITLSEWIFNAIVATEVLTISRDYFRLRGGLERRLYSIARKHCGYQPCWEITLARLHEKSGTSSSIKRFRFDVKAIAKSGLLPDYEVNFDDAADKVVFSPRDGGMTLRNRIAEAERRGLRTLESMLSVAIAGVAITGHLIR
jgi:plasmid replication initiation protein